MDSDITMADASAALGSLSSLTPTTSQNKSLIPSTVNENQSVNDLDRWIEMLMDCKQLSEEDVKRLCDKVSLLNCARWQNWL